MPIRAGPSSAVFGWLLLLAGIVYILLGAYGTMAEAPGSLPRVVVGLVAVVVGSSVVRWAKRTADRQPTDPAGS
jgi:xanthosine utilization system XapX-like protein